ncbi:hypothetical protein WMF20_28755 [Sorangium sp. So ce834]|uniref:hypothetical protein n=1 Tax=Sorangium sp. So ce834 TaxID=3133321 RepID=UPI003F5DA4FB
MAKRLAVDILKESGYRIVDETGDASMNLTLAINKWSGVFQWVKNGKVLGGYTVRARLDVSLDEQLVDSVRDEFRVTLDEIQRDQLVPLIESLNSSQKMKPFGQLVSRHRANLAKIAAAKQKAEEKAAFEKWHSTYASPCRKATSASDCDRLVEWLSDETNDKDPLAAEGKRVLADAEPRLAELRDDDAWRRASSESCLELATERDCDRVRSYISNFPDGRHRDEALVAIKNLDKMSTQRAAEHEAEERRAEMEESRRQREDAARAREAMERAGAEQERQRKDAVRRQCRVACSSKCGAVLEQNAFNACMSSCVGGCQ